MAELKTRENDASVEDFLATIDDDTKRADAETVCRLMAGVTGEEPRMWGTAIVGFGRYRYEYSSGRTGEWHIVGFSPRKRNLTLYIMPGFSAYEKLMARLGKHKTGKSCLYVNKLADIELDVLKELVTRSVEHMREKYKA